MNILHTSDLHLGKRLFDRERLAEQEEVLDEIVSICEREQVDLVLIAGDVFDTFLPSAEAEELSDFLRQLYVSGPLAEEEGIYIFGNRPRVFPTGGSRPVRAVEAGEYYLVIGDAKGDRVYINALPYPNEARFHEGRSEESFSENKIKNF